MCQRNGDKQVLPTTSSVFQRDLKIPTILFMTLSAPSEKQHSDDVVVNCCHQFPAPGIKAL
ncbi:hypothetical protein A464_3705 [Salmonella bongori N268-08]|uniref:Uncharacterized protein n=1 Tax=Salmonella bongori N268-08 TaxID=1197719 RepID=S5N1X2_SALBN|nr:hypothetical protein A464_3705 [Salmonella bongori N268-08]